MDVKTLRTEIKAWEHAFKKEHSRNPSVTDIRDQPNIAEKYKLYKKLSKLSANPVIHSDTPTTPSSSSAPRSPSFLPKKNSVTRSHYPLSEANPFSPTKKKAGNGFASGNLISHPPLSPNPFSTPVKNKLTNGTIFARDDPPDPFLSTSSSPRASTSSRSIPHNLTINKARKRLHGDPVTPSPKKEKKRRLAKAHEDTDESADDMVANADLSIVEESPIKRPNGSKTFISLFDDPIQTRIRRPMKVPFAFPNKLEYSIEPVLVTRNNPSVADKGLSESATIASSDRKREERDHSTDNDKTIIMATGKSLNTKKSENFNDCSVSQIAPANLSEQRSPSAKRPNLIPPSPPPPDTITAGSLRENVHRKKPNATPKIVDDDIPDDDEEEIVEWMRPLPAVRHNENTESDDTDFDVELKSLQKPDNYYTAPDETSENDEAEGQIDIDLPEDLRNMLAISPRSRHREESTLVKHLLYGKRSRQLNDKGGEVWGVGEIDALEDNSEDQDDWAGEGVPWEAADM